MSSPHSSRRASDTSSSVGSRATSRRKSSVTRKYHSTDNRPLFAVMDEAYMDAGHSNTHQVLSNLIEEFQRVCVEEAQKRLPEGSSPPELNSWEMTKPTFCNTFSHSNATSRVFCEHLFDFLLKPKLNALDREGHSKDNSRAQKTPAFGIRGEIRPDLQSTSQVHAQQVEESTSDEYDSVVSASAEPLLDVATFAREMLRFLELDAGDRIDLMIQIYDVDGDGLISSKELTPLIESAFAESGLPVPAHKIQEAIESIILSKQGIVSITEEDFIEKGTDVRGLTYAEVREVLGSCFDAGQVGTLFLDGPQTESTGGLVKSIQRAPSLRKHANEPKTAKPMGMMKQSLHTFRQKLSKVKKAKPQHLRQWLWMEWKFNRPRMVWLTLYIVSNILVFICKFLLWKYSSKYSSARALMNNGICFAKAFAEVAVFNGGLILFPICRKFLGVFRDHTPMKLWKWIPFNDNIAFHILAGHILMIAAVGHTISHLINFSRYSKVDQAAWDASPLAGHMNGPHPTYWDMMKSLPGWTGHAMLLIMVIAYPMAAFFRQKHFNTFWFTHQLYLLWIILFMVHGLAHIFQPAHAIWVALPGFVIYLGERLQRVLCKEISRVEVVHAETYDDTTVLFVKKPPFAGFTFSTPGCYASLQISKIARFEWHPFTISSAPGDKYLRFHIRRAGDWTTALWEYVREREELSELATQAYVANENLGTDCLRSSRQLAYNLSNLNFARSHLTVSGEDTSDDEDDIGELDDPNMSLTATSKSVKSEEDIDPTARGAIFRSALRNFSPVYIHGPFGAPTQDFLRYRVLVLVGAGIGVTPFASILRHILLNWRSHQCSECFHVNHRFTPQDFVQFHWVTREHENLSWFAQEMSELAQMDVEGRLEMHQHLTGVKSKSDSMAHQLVTSFHTKVHSANRQDIISGVKGSKQLTHLGRPDWKKYFGDLAAKYPRQTVGVFYCGPAVLQEVLQRTCKQSSTSKKKGGTKFVFYHENF